MKRDDVLFGLIGPGFCAKSAIGVTCIRLVSYFLVGADPAKGKHIKVMSPGSSPVPRYENGYWRGQKLGVYVHVAR